MTTITPSQPLPDTETYIFEKDNACDLRGKLFLIFASSVTFLPIVRFSARCICLLTGSWVSAGQQKVQKIWEQECLQKASSSDPLPPKPTNMQVAKSVLTELAKDIVKCATIPFEMLALMFASVYGMIDPFGGRKLVARIEHLWSITTPLINLWPLRYVNYLAPCMQTTQIWKQQNLFRCFSNYNPETLRSLLLPLEMLDQNGLQHLGLSEKFAIWKHGIEKISAHDESETDPDGKLITPDMQIPPLREAFIALLQACNRYKEDILDNAGNPRVKRPEHDDIDRAIDNVDQLISKLRTTPPSTKTCCVESPQST